MAEGAKFAFLTGKFLLSFFYTCELVLNDALITSDQFL